MERFGEKPVSTRSYFYENDRLIDVFIKGRLYKGEGFTEQAVNIYDEFKKWWIDVVGSKYVPSLKRFGRRMGEKFKRYKKGGVYYYDGVCLLKRKTNK